MRVDCDKKQKQKTYGKCPKILYTKPSDKMAYEYSTDSDQIYTVCNSRVLRNNCMKIKISAKKVWNKVFEILGHLPSL